MKVSLQETPGGSIDGVIPETFAVSPDGRRFAYVAQVDHPMAHLLPDSLRSSVPERQPLGQRVVVDGADGKQYEGTRHGPPLFSPDSRRVAYAAGKDGRWVAVIDGEEEGDFDAVGDMVFSADSRRLAYAAQQGPLWHVVVDGKPGKGYEQIGGGTVMFGGRDGRRLAYVALSAGRLRAIVDGQESNPYEGIAQGSMVFSPDGAHYAFVAFAAGKEWVVLDGRDGQSYDSVLRGAPLFSPNSERLAHRAKRRGKEFVVCDNREGKPYATVSRTMLYFSPDSKHLAYLAASEPGKSFIVLDGVEGPVYETILDGCFHFSPDGGRNAFGVRGGSGSAWIIDGRAQPIYDAISASRTGFVFSPDSRRFAYVALKRKRQVLVVDGHEMGAYAMLGDNSPVFSPDSRHVVSSAEQDAGDWRLFVDGNPVGEPYQNAFGSIVFSATNRFHLLTQRDGEVLLVEGTLAAG